MSRKVVACLLALAAVLGPGRAAAVYLPSSEPRYLDDAPPDPRTLNRYLYAFGNPLRYSDPTGYLPMDGASTDTFNDSVVGLTFACADGNQAACDARNLIAASGVAAVAAGVGTMMSAEAGLVIATYKAATAGESGVDAISFAKSSYDCARGDSSACYDAAGAGVDLISNLPLPMGEEALARRASKSGGSGGAPTVPPSDSPRATSGGVAPAPSGGEPRIVYHYTDADEAEFRTGFWKGSSATDTPDLTADEAMATLGVKTPPDKIIPMVDRGHFAPNRPAVVDPHPLGLGGGVDLVSKRRVPPQDILPAIPVKK